MCINLSCTQRLIVLLEIVVVFPPNSSKRLFSIRTVVWKLESIFRFFSSRQKMTQEKKPLPPCPFSLWYAAGSTARHGREVCVSADAVIAQTALNCACRGKRGPGYYRVSLVAHIQFLASVTSLSSWFMVYRYLRTLIKRLLLNFLTMY